MLTMDTKPTIVRVQIYSPAGLSRERELRREVEDLIQQKLTEVMEELVESNLKADAEEVSLSLGQN